ncbi:ABC transporter [Bacteroidia bacterium]|nr:ABC transporter [Bacteroidia bacterium]
MITINNISISYNNKRNVINGLNLKIAANTINGIVGLNGAGKTTLFNAIFGLKTIQNGEILLDNQPFTKKSMAYLPAENYFFYNITGREYLQLFKKDFTEIEKWNKLFQLPLNQQIEEYSTGMKKKLAIFGVLMQEKPIVLLDEPFNGLDIETCRLLRLVLLRLKESCKTLIVSSHIIETLTNLCDEIHLLESGKITKSVSQVDFSTFEKEVFQTIENERKGLIERLM